MDVCLPVGPVVEEHTELAPLTSPLHLFVPLVDDWGWTHDQRGMGRHHSTATWNIGLTHWPLGDLIEILDM